MRVAVVIATIARPDEVSRLVASLIGQSRPPDSVVLSVHSAADLPEVVPPTAISIYGSKGASMQRNRGMALVVDFSDVIIFFDDDFVPSRYYVENVVKIFRSDESIVGATGLVLQDGARSGKSISQEEAHRAIDIHEKNLASIAAPSDIDVAYGCNMCFRVSAIGPIRFDETLPLYSWLEDVDFSSRIKINGRVVSSEGLVGVHLGVSSGRTSGFKFGYSQMVNPVYLVRKGTMRRKHALNLMTRNLLANHSKSFFPGERVDRRGRAFGNWRGLMDLVVGRADPKKILEFP